MRSPDEEGTWDADELTETPATARARVKRLAGGLGIALQELRRARDRELDADHAYQRAQIEAQLSPHAPVVERGGATVADKKAWVDRVTSEQRFQRDLAEKERIAAGENYRRLETQCSLAQSILKSVDADAAREMGGMR